MEDRFKYFSLVSFGNVNGEKGNDVIEVDYLMAKVEI